MTDKMESRELKLRLWKPDGGGWLAELDGFEVCTTADRYTTGEHESLATSAVEFIVCDEDDGRGYDYRYIHIRIEECHDLPED